MLLISNNQADPDSRKGIERSTEMSLLDFANVNFARKLMSNNNKTWKQY